jgi:hypothetical protein
VDTRPTPTTTHSADGTDDVAARWLRAEGVATRRQGGLRRAAGEGGGRARCCFRLMARAPGSRQNLRARAWFPSKPGRARSIPAESGRERNGVQINRVSPLAIAGAIGYDSVLPLFREK